MEPMTAFKFVVNSMGGLSPEQLDSFKDIRAFFNNDAKFFDAIFRFTAENNMSPQQATKVIIQAWDTLNQMPTDSRPTLQLINQGIVVGHGHILTIQQLNELPPTTLNFVYQQLAPLNVDQSAKWQLIKTSVGSANINENQLLTWAASQTTHAGRLPAVMSNLLWLQSFGLFTQCPVTLLLPSGNTVVEMNRHLRISLVYLRSVGDGEKMRNLIQGVGKLPADPSSQPNWNQSDLRKLVVQQLRLRFEFQRREAINQILRQLPRDVHNRLDVLQPHEKDRLYTIAADMSQLTNVGNNVIPKAFQFAVVMQFRNVSELAAYFQFAVVEFHNEAKIIRDENRKKNIQEASSSRNSRAADRIFNDYQFTNLRQRYDAAVQIVRNNGMAQPPVQLQSGLSDAALVDAIRRVNVTYAAETSAAYHIVKHPTNPIGDHVRLANQTIRHQVVGVSPTVSLNQEGDTRFIEFQNEMGIANVLERDGRVLLMTFRQK